MTITNTPSSINGMALEAFYDGVQVAEELGCTRWWVIKLHHKLDVGHKERGRLVFTAADVEKLREYRKTAKVGAPFKEK